MLLVPRQHEAVRRQADQLLVSGALHGQPQGLREHHLLGVEHLLSADGRDDPEGPLRAGETQQDDQLLPVGASDPHVPSLPRLRASPFLALPQQTFGYQPGDDHGRGARVRAGVIPGDTREGHPVHRQPDGPLPTGAARLPNGVLHPRQAYGRAHVLPCRRPPLRQLPDVGVPRRQGDLRDERHRSTVHAGRLPRHGVPPVRRVRRRGAGPGTGLGGIGALPPRHAVRLRDTAPVAPAQLRRTVRADHQPVQREDLHLHLVLVRVPLHRQHGEPVQVARSLALLARSGAVRAQAAEGIRHGAARAGRAGEVHGELPAEGRHVHPAAHRHEYGRSDRRRDAVRTVEQLQPRAASDRREARPQAGGQGVETERGPAHGGRLTHDLQI